jgi:uncharacterized membrane protein HdeD (DUF308 family)
VGQLVARQPVPAGEAGAALLDRDARVSVLASRRLLVAAAFAERDANELWWFGLIAGVAMIIVAFWTAGQFFIEKAYVLLVFAGIWALFHGVGELIRAFQIRKLRDRP